MKRNSSDQDEFDPKLFSRRMSPRVIAQRLEMEVNRIFDGTRRRMRAQKKLGRLDEGRWGESANDWLSCEVYLLVRRLRRTGHLDALNGAIERTPVKSKGLHDISDQPFKLALFLIFGDLMVPVLNSPLSRNQRSELGDALAYADFHNVPSKFLNGFIKQARLKECRAKLKAKYVEPRFHPFPT